MSDYTPEQIEEMHRNADHANFTIEIKHREHCDSHDVYYYKGKDHVGYGYIAKEQREGVKKDHIALIRCPACERENYAMNVSSGYCTWCPFNANGENE